MMDFILVTVEVHDGRGDGINAYSSGQMSNGDGWGIKIESYDWNKEEVHEKGTSGAGNGSHIRALRRYEWREV